MSGKDPVPSSQAYEGVKAPNPPNQIIATRDPTTSDTKYPLGTMWLNKTTGTSWQIQQTPGVWGKLGAGVAGPVETLTGDSGGAIAPVAGNITIAGTANQITSVGSAGTETLSLIGPYTPATYTAHGVLIGEGTSSIVATAVGSTGQVLIGSNAADPAFGALGVNSALTAHGVLLGENNSAIVATTAGSTGQVLIGSTGADPAFGALGVNSGLTAHGVLLAENNSAFVATAVGSTGQVLTGVTGADPVWLNLPAFNIVDSTGTTQALAVNTVYVSDHASAQVVFTLPASATLGQSIQILGNGPGGWQIQQNASQAIKQNNLTTTTGTGGSLTSTSRYNCVMLKCVVAGASTIWNVADFSGSFTFV